MMRNLRAAASKSWWPWAISPQPGPSETLAALERCLAEHLLAFVLLGKAWSHGHTAAERAKIGRQRNGVLVEIAALQERIAMMVEPARA